MSLESIITEHLDIWTSAINAKSASGRGSSNKLELYGIKKLRELILDLAVKGKLVPQDLNEESAAILLNSIKEEKAELVREKKIRKSNSLPEIANDECPFDVPENWEFERLGNVVDIVRGITFPASAKQDEPNENNVACLRTANVQADIDWDDLIYVDRSYVKRDDQYLAPSDIVMSMANSRELVGKVAFAHTIPTNSSFGGFLSVLRPRKLLPDYIMLLLRTRFARETLIGSASQTTNIANISLEKLNPLIIPVPPRKEQERIAAKVHELMALCDQLESQTEASIEAHKILVKSLLETLTNAKDADELNESWQRISAHFDVLFTTADSIDQLKQTILQLAVMGKLVKQDPNDEPASKLLERIAAEKELLIKDKKIKKQKPLPEISEQEKPFDIPDGWSFCRLDDICFGITSGSTPPKSEFRIDDGVPYLKVYNIRNQKVDFDYQRQFVSNEFHKLKLTRSILKPKDVIMNIVGPPLGKVAVVPEQYPEWNCNQAIVFFRPIQELLSPYIYQYLIAGTFLNSIELIGTAGQDNISVTKSRSIVLPLPPRSEQARIIKKASQMLTLCEKLNEKLRKTSCVKMKLTDSLASVL